MLLRLTDLGVRYGPIAALDGVTVDCDAGELVAVIGPNGAGKSTMLRAVAGCLAGGAARRGAIELDGRSVAGRPPEAIVRLGAALVPEGRRIFTGLTVYENLLLGARKQPLDDLLELFPVLADKRDDPAGRLSGGEQQQLAIARALALRPRLLMLDEPSLGLAPLVVERVYEVLAELRSRGIGVLLVEQNALGALELADRAYVLRRGRIELEGPSAALLADGGFMQAYFGAAIGAG